MAVKDVQVGAAPPPTRLESRDAPRVAEQSPADFAVVGDQVTFNSDRRTLSNQRLRGALNKVIDATNYASAATEEISRLFSGVEGIVEQLNDTKLPANRVQILEREANELVEKIKRTATNPAPDGSRPLAGDKIKLEVEETLGKALEIILPDNAKDAFGLGSIRFSPKELIVNTVTNVEKARVGMEELRKKLADGIGQVRFAAQTVDVATTNAEASTVNLRDLDRALELAFETRGGIRLDPDQALGSVGAINRNALRLLKI